MESESDRMPFSVRIAIVGWAIVIGGFCWLAYGVAQEGDWGVAVFWLLPACFCFYTILGILNRTMRGWWWSRFLSQLLGIFSSVPFLFGVGYIAYRLFGGRVPDEMSFVTGLLAVLGIYCILPAAVCWTIYFTVNSQSARRYCRVCPRCLERIRAPIHVFFDDYKCDECRTSHNESTYL
jgi:hypothetical protein